MIGRKVRNLVRDEAGAIAPLYALALFGLVGIAGVGFDYARVMALDTELQNAADQAALAAATQLDGKSDSITRAISAANTYFATTGADFVNQTRLSNDGAGRDITGASYRFWQTYDADTLTGEITDPTKGTLATVVEVTINKRSVQYALTPIVGAISGEAGATATATLGTAYCNVPPMMFCSPEGSTFNVDNYVGRAVKMHMLPNSPGADDIQAPGVFGFIDFPYPKPSDVTIQNTRLGWNVLDAGCAAGEMESDPGARDTEPEALNSRFDMIQSPIKECKASGTFCPSQNTTKNWVKKQEVSAKDQAELDAASCDGTGDWVPVASVPSSVGVSNPGYTHNSCLDDGSCDGDSQLETAFDAVEPTASWDYDGYMARNYGTAVDPTGKLGGEPTDKSRWGTYSWELSSGKVSTTGRVLGRELIQGNKGNLYCAYNAPIDSSPVVPNETTGQKDRRILTVAASDCSDLNGKGVVDVITYIDLFLLNPAIQGGEKQFYAEVVKSVDDGGNDDYVKKKAILIR